MAVVSSSVLDDKTAVDVNASDVVPKSSVVGVVCMPESVLVVISVLSCVVRVGVWGISLTVSETSILRIRSACASIIVHRLKS